VLIAVTDVGTGLDRANIDRIFNAFFTPNPKGWAWVGDLPLDRRGSWRPAMASPQLPMAASFIYRASKDQ